MIEGKSTKAKGGSYLDPHHTHFLLIDDGESGHAGEIDFRARLETELSKIEQGVDGISTIFTISTILIYYYYVYKILILFKPSASSS